MKYKVGQRVYCHIQIDVDDYNGDLANDIANTWAQLFVEWRDEQNARQNKEDRVYAEPIDWATTYRLLRPKTSVNVAAGGIFGIVLGSMVVFVLEWVEAGLITEAKDLEREMGMPVLGMIPPAS